MNYTVSIQPGKQSNLWVWEIWVGDFLSKELIAKSTEEVSRPRAEKEVLDAIKKHSQNKKRGKVFYVPQED